MPQRPGRPRAPPAMPRSGWAATLWSVTMAAFGARLAAASKTLPIQPSAKLFCAGISRGSTPVVDVKGANREPESSQANEILR